MIKNYLKTALRNIYKNKTFAFINIIGMAFGLATAIIIFMWVADELSYDDFHTKKDNIYRVVSEFKNVSQASMCGALAPAIKKEIPEVKESVKLWGGWDTQIYYNDNTVVGKGSYTESSFFDVFTFPLIEGDKDNVLKDDHSIVITKSMAKALFGNESPVGKVVQIKNRRDKKEDFLISGVIEDVPYNSHIQFGFLFSFKLLDEWYRSGWAEQWDNFSFYTYILVNNNSSVDQLNNKITQVFKNHSNFEATFYIEPLSEVYQNASVLNRLGPSGNGLYVKLFFILGILILVVASINYVNLATAQSITRIREFGLRKIIGAGKIELALQNFGESILTVLISFPLAILFVQLVIPLFNNITGRTLQIDYINANSVLGAIGITLIVGIVSGIYPSLVVSSINPINILRESTGRFGTIKFFRKALVVFQFSLSIIVIVSTIIISQQMNYIQNTSLGFEKENILYAWVPGKDYKIVKQELLKNPDIINVGASGAQLDWIGWSAGINRWDGKTNDDYISFSILEVGYDYLDTYKMQMKSGRYYSPDFSTDLTDNIVINESAAKIMKLDNPIGKTLTYGGNERRIIGVVKDFHYESMREQIGPMLFILYPEQLGCLGIRISGNDVAGTMSYINNVFKTKLPNEIIELRFLDEQLNQLYKDETIRGKLFFSFSLISITIAVLGLFGLAAYSLQRRKKEMGIRKVIGASTLNIISAMTKQYIVWILMSNIIAIPIAYFFMSSWLEDFAYRIDIAWWVFLLAGAIVLLIALATVSFQAIKAATANPVEALKYE